MVVALHLLQQHWLWAMLAGGVLLSWLVYLAHYGAPDSVRPDATPALDPDPETHEFADGLQEGDRPVPPVLRLFFLLMFLFAAGYVAWMRWAVLSY